MLNCAIENAVFLFEKGRDLEKFGPKKLLFFEGPIPFDFFLCFFLFLLCLRHGKVLQKRPHYSSGVGRV